MQEKRIVVVPHGCSPATKNGLGGRIRLTVEALSDLGEVSVLIPTADPSGIPLDPAFDETLLQVSAHPSRMPLAVRAVAGRMPRRTAAFDFECLSQAVAAAAPPSVDLWWAISDTAAHAIGPLGRGASVVDFVDYEGDRWVTAADERPGPVPHRLLRRLAARGDRWALRFQIRRLLEDFDVGVVSSDIDRRSSGADLRVLANAVDIGPHTSDEMDAAAPRSDDLLFLGFLNYGPNADAIEWLVADIMPEVWRDLPDAHLRIVGRGRVPAAAGDHDRITAAGEVDDAPAEFRRAAVLVVPLRHGSGSRVKVIEAWATGTPVISTAKGVEGLDAVEGLHYLRAETPAEFAAAIARLHSRPQEAAALAGAGRALHASTYGAEQFRRAVIDIAAPLLER